MKLNFKVDRSAIKKQFIVNNPIEFSSMAYFKLLRSIEFFHLFRLCSQELITKHTFDSPFGWVLKKKNQFLLIRSFGLCGSGWMLVKWIRWESCVSFIWKLLALVAWLNVRYTRTKNAHTYFCVHFLSKEQCVKILSAYHIS